MGEPAAAPSFWDPRRRPERPDLPAGTVLRFVTEVNYPPFNYAGEDGNPVGFNVDLARLACEELGISCTVQMRRFDTLLDALVQRQADAAVASIASSPEARRRAEFTEPYYRLTARFVARRTSSIADVRPERLAEVSVGVVENTAHAAFLRELFAGAAIRPFESEQAARNALRAGEIDLIFGDGIALALWLNGSDSAGCCAFRGGPFMESRYFGEGIGMAVAKGNEPVRRALNWALFRLWERGRIAELWLRYFPVSPF